MYIAQLNLVFIHIPKCAGTSVEKCLPRLAGIENEPLDCCLLQKNKNPLKGPPSLGHLRACDYVSKGHISQQQWDQAFKFSIVRNPLSRLVSIYNYRNPSWRARIRGINQWTFRQFVLDYFPQWYDENHLKGHDNWTHIQPMWKMLYDPPGNKLLVDYIAKMETLESDFELVREQANLPETLILPRENSSTAKNPATGETVSNEMVRSRWWEYYDDDTFKFAKSFYEKDFDLFGYDPVLPSH